MEIENPWGSILIFLHVEKTGGLTLRDLLARQYPPDGVYKFSEPRFSAEAFRVDMATTDVRHIQGHMDFGIHQYIDRRCIYLTMLRDPIERMISGFYYSRQRNPDSYFHDISLEDFVAEPGRDNVQTRRISGFGRLGLRDPANRCPAEMLDRAKENLEQHFALAGTTELFDESVILWKRLFGWSEVAYVRINVTEDRPARASLSKTTQEIVARFNQLDLDLHRYVRGRLEQEMARQGADFRREVDEFKLTNLGDPTSELCSS